MMDDQYDIWDNSDDPMAQQPQPAVPQVPAYNSPNLSYDLPNLDFYGLGYWQQRDDTKLPGMFESGMDDIFDQNGQLRPGWRRTERGYEQMPVAAAPPPPSSNPPPPGNPWPPSSDDRFGFLTEQFNRSAPQWRTGPGFTPPTFTPPPPFSYKTFAAPATDSIYADPSYKFRLGEGQRAVEQSAAGRGLLRTGGTLKDISNYGQNAASQEYSNIFKRAVDAHNLGLQQELGTYGTNYGVSRDVYDRLYEGSKAQFDAQQRENELVNKRDFDSFLADFDIFEKQKRRVGDYLFGAAGMGG